MSQEYRILILEDVPHDTELIERELHKGKIEFISKRVRTKEAFLRELDEFAFDIILSDYSLPQFNGMEAFRLIKAHNFDVPFIFVTGTLPEEVAIECLREGIDDYIIKANLKRLPTAVLGALEKKQAERERRKAEAELRESEERFRMLVEGVKDYAIFMLDAEGCVESWNAGAERLKGYTAEEIIGEHFSRFYTPEDIQNDKPERGLKTAIAEERYQEEGWRVRLDGTRFWADVVTTALRDESGKLRGFARVTRDITERKRAEDERIESLAREQAARAEAESANRLKDEFLAVVSHELRTPLTAVLGWTHILRSKRLDETASDRALETIERNARSQTQLIDDLLDVSRITTGKLYLDMHPVNLASVIEAALNSVRPVADVKRIRIETMFDKPTGLVSGDPNRLQQVVWNLLSNAVKFTPDGGQIEVRLKHLDSQVEITVSDNGMGISTEFLPHIFDRFRQADSTTTRTHGGLGLGLSIARHLVELHGGTIQAESREEGRGAIFIVRLRHWIKNEPKIARSVESYRAGLNSEKSSTLSCPPELNHLRVLVVDDEPDTLELLTAVFKLCGAEVAGASSTVEALDTLKKMNPHVLVSDLGMPDEDGYELIRKVRALGAEHGGRIPAVALTAYAREEDRMRALLAGFHVHMVKPVNPDELMVVVASLTGRTGSG